MSCQADYVCITYPAWYVVVIIGFVVVMVVVLLGYAAWEKRR